MMRWDALRELRWGAEKQIWFALMLALAIMVAALGIRECKVKRYCEGKGGELIDCTDATTCTGTGTSPVCQTIQTCKRRCEDAPVEGP